MGWRLVKLKDKLQYKSNARKTLSKNGNTTIWNILQVSWCSLLTFCKYQKLESLFMKAFIAALKTLKTKGKDAPGIILPGSVPWPHGIVRRVRGNDKLHTRRYTDSRSPSENRECMPETHTHTHTVRRQGSSPSRL